VFIQAAIDAPNMVEAMRTLERLSTVETIDYFEIGAPLITHYGIEALESFRRRVPISKTYGDLKTIDFPEMEYTPWLVAGCRRLSVMAVMNDGAFCALRQLQNLWPDLEVFVSLMGYPPHAVKHRVDTLHSIGFRNFIAHGAGVTTETAFSDMLQYCHYIRSAGIKLSLIAAGGITTENCIGLKVFAPDGLIIGRGLTGAKDAQTAAEVIQRVRERCKHD
jgi:3-keto-L-gulonate-6-phosphate decarboxylase